LLGHIGEKEKSQNYSVVLSKREDINYEGEEDNYLSEEG
jgi:hypothetical protein